MHVGRKVRSGEKASESRRKGPDAEDFLGQPFRDAGAPRMSQARIAALVVDRRAVRSERLVPRRAVHFEKRGPAVSQLAAPAVVDRRQRFGMPSHAGHRLNDEVLVERRVGKALLPVREGVLPQALLLGGRGEAGVHGIRRREKAERSERIGMLPQLSAFLFDVSGVLLGDVGVACGPCGPTEFVPRAQRQHLVRILGLRAVRILESGSEPFVPAEKL